MPRVKRLVRHGNSQAIILDRSLMDVVGIEPNSLVSIDVRDNRLVVGPADTSAVEKHKAVIKEALDKGNKKYGRMLKRLAQNKPETEE